MSMVRKDLHNNVEEVNALHAQVISTNTTTHGQVIDTQGYSALEFILQVSSWTDGTYTVLLEEGNQANLSDAATVNAANIFGALPAPAANNAVARVGYRLWYLSLCSVINCFNLCYNWGNRSCYGLIRCTRSNGNTGYLGTFCPLYAGFFFEDKLWKIFFWYHKPHQNISKLKLKCLKPARGASNKIKVKTYYENEIYLVSDHLAENFIKDGVAENAGAFSGKAKHLHGNKALDNTHYENKSA